MNDVIIALNWVNDIVFVSLVNIALQMTLLILLVALFIWIFRVKSAATRYSLWLFALFALILLPLLTPFIPHTDFTRLSHQGAAGYSPDDMMKLRMEGSDAGKLPEASYSAPSTIAARGREMDVPLVNPVSVVYFIWCAGALFISWRTTGIYRKLRGLRMRSSDVEDKTALEILSRLTDRLVIRRVVSLKASSEICSPISMGIFSPVIIIPDSLTEGSRGTSELEMILTHELAHIKRCDYLVCLFQNILRAVFFFHPLFHLMYRNLAKEREHICDDWVIYMTRRRSRYAECIITLLEKAAYKPVSIPVTIAMAERKRDIPGRIDMIVDTKRKIATKVSKKALIALLLAGCLSLPLIGGIELVRIAIARPASNEGQIVFRRWAGDGEADTGIWVIDANGENEKQLTTGNHWSPRWSSDGKQIVFQEYDQAERAGTGIYIMDADGSNIRQLTDDPGDDYPDWSPDGKQIAFARFPRIDRKIGDIYVIDADGANLRKLIEGVAIGGSAQDPDWSPDGTKIVLDVDMSDRRRIWVIDADGGNPKMVQDRGFYPAWSPDGKRITFISRRDAWIWGTNATWIYVMDANGGNVQTFAVPGPSRNDHPRWSPDGAKIIFDSNRDGNYEIYVMDADGQNVQRLTNTPETECYPDWWAASLYTVEPAGKLRSTWGKIKRGLFSN